jgi:uncharacterized membrane protein
VAPYLLARLMVSTVKHWMELLAVGVEAGAAVVIGIAVVFVLVRVLPVFLPRGHLNRREPMAVILQARLRLGRWLALALELTLAADILRTAVAPTWDEIGKLAAIATLRTALNYFLEREIRQEDRPDIEIAMRNEAQSK